MRAPEPPDTRWGQPVSAETTPCAISEKRLQVLIPAAVDVLVGEAVLLGVPPANQAPEAVLESRPLFVEDRREPFPESPLLGQGLLGRRAGDDLVQLLPHRVDGKCLDDHLDSKEGLAHVLAAPRPAGS